MHGVERFGDETYMGPSFHAALAALCEDDTMADRALAAGEALLRQGSVLHNQIGFAEFASACHWRRGQPARSTAAVQRAQGKFGAEPVGVLQACTDWMRSTSTADTTPGQIVLGTMTFGGQVDKAGSARLVERFQERGHRQLDTAYVYNDGATETLLGEFREDGGVAELPIAGKANPWEPDGPTQASLVRQLEISLERLAADSLDLFYLHAPDLDTPIEKTLAAVADQHAAGRFRRFRLSNYAAWQVAEIVGLCTANGWP